LLQESSYSEKNPIYLLLGEVCETIQEQGFENIAPSVIAEVASRIATVLADPSHMMYGKVNKFLNKAPVWEAQKIISYWIDRVLLKEPEDDNGYDLEVSWLLELVVDGLRTSEVSYVPRQVLCRTWWLFAVPPAACHCRTAA
jgi:nucleolar pre-ribosomal-associated protein 1